MAEFIFEMASLHLTSFCLYYSNWANASFTYCMCIYYFSSASWFWNF